VLGTSLLRNFVSRNFVIRNFVIRNFVPVLHYHVGVTNIEDYLIGLLCHKNARFMSMQGI
jgi:hypothetical protein